MPFPREYLIDQNPFYPEAWEASRIDFAATDSLGMASIEVAELVFFPSEGDSWRGSFRIGDKGLPTLIASTPSPHHCVVSAGGIAYAVDVNEKTSNHIETRFPVTQLVEAQDIGLLFLVDLADITAIDTGVRWKAKNLAMDDLHVLSVEGRSLRYKGFILGENIEYVATISEQGLSDTRAIGPEPKFWKSYSS